MKKFFSLFLPLLALFTCITMNLNAAVVKRPLTVKSYGDQYYLEWTGSAPVVTADELDLMADTATANVFGVDPFYFRMANNRAATTGPWNSYPGVHFPEKLCVSVTTAGDGDATTSDVYVTQAATKNGTFRKMDTAQAITSTASTTVIDQVRLTVTPVLFWKLIIDPTTATDSMEVLAVRAYSCDD